MPHIHFEITVLCPIDKTAQLSIVEHHLDPHPPNYQPELDNMSLLRRYLATAAVSLHSLNSVRLVTAGRFSPPVLPVRFFKDVGTRSPSEPPCIGDRTI